MSDFYSDQGALFVKLFHGTELPEFVKRGSYETDLSVSHLPSSAFADRANRKFPIHTAADTYVSAAYFHANGINDPSTESNLKVAATIHGIEPEVAEALALAKQAAVVDEPVLSDPLWSVRTDTASYCGIGEHTFKSACDHFLVNFGSIDFAERGDLAAQFSKVASDMGSELPEGIAKMAGIGHCNREILEAAIQQRALSLHDPRLKRDLILKAAAIHEIPDMDQEQLGKVAEFLNDVDVENGLTRHYGRGIIDPHRAIWNETEAAFEKRSGLISIGARQWKRANLDERLGNPEVLSGLRECGLDPASLGSLSGEQASLANQILLS